jgi:hypothetical protein
MHGSEWRRPVALSMALIIAVSTVAGCSLLADSRPMLPLGTASNYNRPYQPCSPSLLPAIPMQGPSVSEAFEMDDLQAQTGQAAPSEIVSYDIGGHKPLAAGSLHVTVPPARATLRTSPDVRLFVDGGGGACIAEWRVSALELSGFDGQQESDSTWRELGAGSGQGDAVVVGGVPAGEWILHIHLAFGPAGTPALDTIEAYARVVADVATASGPEVPRPDLVAACGDSITSGAVLPDMVLGTDGTAWTPGELGVAHGSGNTAPDKMPEPVVAVSAGSLIRVRTADGSCGNNWGGAMFSPVPDDLAAAIAGSGLEYNDGAPSGPALKTPVGGLNAIAPAAGEWLFSVVFAFGDARVATYYWRISVR